jgi:hypothetical protein
MWYHTRDVFDDPEKGHSRKDVSVGLEKGRYHNDVSVGPEKGHMHGTGHNEDRWDWLR